LFILLGCQKIEESASEEFPQEEQGWQQGGLVSRQLFILIEVSSINERGPSGEPRMCGCIYGGCNNLKFGISILQSITFIQFFKCFISICRMMMSLRQREPSSKWPNRTSSRG
jgi:hypothetical protein